MGFQPIQGDYFEKPTGLTAEDLFKWDGSALARLAAGSINQALVVGAGGLQYGNVGQEKIYYRFGLGYLPFPDLTIYNLASTATENSYTGSSTYIDRHDITLNSTLNSNLVSGKSYAIAFHADIKVSSGSDEVGLRLYDVTNDKSLGPTYLGYSNTNQERYLSGCGHTTSTSYGRWGGISTTAKPAGTAATEFKGAIYGSQVKLQFRVKSGNTQWIKNSSIDLIGYAFNLTQKYDITNQILDDYPDYKLVGVNLFDSNDSVKIDDYITVTGITDSEMSNLGYTTNNLITPIVTPSISSIAILGGNPLLIFEKA